MFSNASRNSKRLFRVPAIVSWLAIILVTVVPAWAFDYTMYLTLPGSTFEIDFDSNLVVDSENDPAAIDWISVEEIRKGDAPTGSGDDSFGQGTKEDTAVPTIVDGSIPPNKSDLKFFGVYTETTAAGKFMHLYWTRVQDPEGTTNMDFEFNKSTVVSSNGVTPVRSIGDLLITYDLSKGGTVATLSLRRWDGSAWGLPTVLANEVDAAGSINTTTIDSTNSDGLGTLDPRTFGEATIDLDVIFDPEKCESFGSAYLKSRASDSFTAALKDFIAPVPVNLTNCGMVVIEKQTDPDGATQSFNFSHNIVTDPSNGTDFSLVDDGSMTFLNVVATQPGQTYTVTEAEPTGWDLTNITCSSDLGQSISTDVGAGTADFTVSVDETVTCTYYNQARGKLIVEKVTQGGDGSFDFTSNSLYDFTLNTVSGYASTEFNDLFPGVYDVDESVPAGWDLVSATCDDGSPVNAIDIGPGETVTCTFTDALQGSITVVKATQPSGSAQSFSFNSSWGAFNLMDGQSNNSGSLSSGVYSVSETVPAGWKLENATCDDGSLVSAINLGPGENVTCTFTNSTGAILITKTAKNAAQGGDVALAGVAFEARIGNTVYGNGVTGADGTTCIGGLEVGATYSVVETAAPDGYALAAPQNVNAAAGECTTPINGSPAPVSFENVPLSRVVITFYSLAGPGVTKATDVTCVANGYTSPAAVELQDGEYATFDNLLPETYTCTVVVDP